MERFMFWIYDRLFGQTIDRLLRAAEAEREEGEPVGNERYR
jgi:hypothetical protein